MDILGFNSPCFVSHFILHSVLPIFILFPISSFLWLLLFQVIFTCEESINHLPLSDIKPFQTLFGQGKTQTYKPSMCQIPPLGFQDLGQVAQDRRSPYAPGQRTALCFLPSHLSVGQRHSRCLSKHISDSFFIPLSHLQGECPSLPPQLSSFLKICNLFFFILVPLPLPWAPTTLPGHGKSLLANIPSSNASQKDDR